MKADVVLNLLYPFVNALSIVAMSLRFKNIASKIFAIGGLGLIMLAGVVQKIFDVNQIRFWEWQVPVFPIIYLLCSILILIGYFLLKAKQNEEPPQRISKDFFNGVYIAGALLFFSCIVFGLAMLLGYRINPSSELSSKSIGWILISIGILTLIFVSIVYLVTIYKLWSIFPPSFARTSPGQAVGFLFIPFFNYYWIFVAILGWSKDYNKFIAEKRISAPPLPESIAMAYCIITLVSVFILLGIYSYMVTSFSGIPNLGTIIIIQIILGILSISQFIIQILFISKACDGANAVLAHSASSNQQ
jgi:hypothetical protein